MWWNKKYGKTKICGITMSRLRAGKDKQGLSYCVFLPCEHGFYRKAIAEWVSQDKNTCPMCRKQFDPIIIVI